MISGNPLPAQSLCFFISAMGVVGVSPLKATLRITEVMHLTFSKLLRS